MCLYIDGYVGKSLKDVAAPTPLVATRPILVYKVLCMLIDGSIVSYFHIDYKWNYGELHKVSELCPESGSIWYSDVGDIPAVVIEAGIHALTDMYSELIDQYLWGFSSSVEDALHSTLGVAIRPAIIPAGSSYFLGDRGDIVATQMIVYEKMEDVPAGWVSIHD